MRHDNRKPRGPRLRPAPTAREFAMQALARVDDGAFANLVLPELFREIERPGSGYAPVEPREKAFATDLVYGTVRMRRACDWLVRHHLQREPDEDTERALHLGAYQLAYLATPPHAAVSETVNLTPERSRGFVNAVLRKVAADVENELEWPSVAVELSYPDWIVEILERDLGADIARDSLRAMNEPAETHAREDGYRQDPASQDVAAVVRARAGERVLDLCAAPGGKATAMAAAGAHVVAVDLHDHRCKLVDANATRLGVRHRVDVHCLDATSLPAELVGDSFDRVLVDAPCSGLGSLRRRPDARWRITQDDVADLVALQRRLLDSAAAAVKPGGSLVYSVCTLTNEESLGIDEWLAEAHPELEPDVPELPEPWQPIGRGHRVLPGETDGMWVFRYRRR